MEQMQWKIKVDFSTSSTHPKKKIGLGRVWRKKSGTILAEAHQKGK